MVDLVVYYSRTNNTKLVAETIHKETKAELLEVKDKKSRSGPIGYLKGAFDALREKKTSIEYEKIDLKKYDKVYVGSPVWASKPVPAIVQYIKENDFNGVKCITFVTMGSGGDESTLDYMNNLIVEGGGKVLNSFSIATSDKNNDIKELTVSVLRNE